MARLLFETHRRIPPRLVPFVGGIVLIVLMCIEGDPGPNPYGPSPKQFACPAAIG